MTARTCSPSTARSSDAVERARRGDGPSLVECKTYRWEGHFVGDQEVYRTREEVRAQYVHDPIRRFQERLVAAGIMTDAEAELIDTAAREEVEDALQYAEESPLPDESLIFTDIFTEE